MTQGAGSELREAVGRSASFGQTVKAVAWSFFGIRKRSGYENDIQKLNPVHLVIAGLLAAALFVGSLIVLVRWVVGSAS
jgi:Protein of unknown function (DUF2970)